MSQSKYREHAVDVYFKSFFLLKKLFKEEGENEFFRIFINTISQGVQNNDPFTLESGLFASKCILDALETTQNHNFFVEQVLNFILTTPLATTNQIVVVGSISFIHEASIYLNFMPSLLNNTLKLILQASVNFPSIEQLAFKTVFEIC